MANNQGVELTVAVTKAGGLGSLPGAAITPDALRAQIREVRDAVGDLPFAVNLFVPPYSPDASFEVVLEERPAVLSYTFGAIDPTPFRERGIVVHGTATSAEEARALDVDAVVAQGAEAGGHRGSFIGWSEVPLWDLIPAITNAPVIAAGGIVDRDGARNARELGAIGVQAGTAFLFTPECGRPHEHLDALRTYDTVITDAYTGRRMRGARTPVLEQLMAGPPPLPFPEQRRASAEIGPLYMGGVSARQAREMSAAELVAELSA